MALALLASGCASVRAASAQAYEFHAWDECSDGKVVLVQQIKNAGKRDISVERKDIPWDLGSRSAYFALHLAGAPVDADDAWVQWRAPDVSGLTIGPGKSYERRVPFETLFPGVDLRDGKRRTLMWRHRNPFDGSYASFGVFELSQAVCQ